VLGVSAVNVQTLESNTYERGGAERGMSGSPKLILTFAGRIRHESRGQFFN